MMTKPLKVLIKNIDPDLKTLPHKNHETIPINSSEPLIICESPINVIRRKIAPKNINKTLRMSEVRKKSVIYVFSETLLHFIDKNPAIKGRSVLVHELIKSYKLLDKLQVIPPRICSTAELSQFHSIDYLSALKNEDELELFGLGYDCPVWKGIFDYCRIIGGSTLAACYELCKKQADIAINWFGGWHHAQKDKGGGYCYVNDIVLGIMLLLKAYKRVLYIDLDVHHGDGVEGAFETSNRVFTLSFHQQEPGFFPGTGDSQSTGFASGKGYSANFPYKSGIDGNLFMKYFELVTSKVLNTFRPKAVIIQCGGDCIVGDPLGGANMVPSQLIRCIKFVLQRNLPTVVLGGGGYNFPHTAKYWTQVTAAIINEKLCDDIPDDCPCFLQFGPDYTLKVEANSILKDLNSEEDFERNVEHILRNLEFCK